MRRVGPNTRLLGGGSSRRLQSRCRASRPSPCGRRNRAPPSEGIRAWAGDSNHTNGSSTYVPGASADWAVSEAHVYMDDGISGAEFASRPGFLRLMNALKPRPPFQVLVMSEQSRLGREAIETAYALKQLVQAGVRVFSYLEDRERTLDSPTDKIMLSLTAFADELEREKSRHCIAGNLCGTSRGSATLGGFAASAPGRTASGSASPCRPGES